MFEHAFNRLKPLARVVLADELKTLQDRVRVCDDMLRRSAAHECELERDLLTANQSPEDYYNWVRKQDGEIPLHETYWGIIKDELEAMGISWDARSVPESNTFYTDEATMNRIVPFLTYPADYYIASISKDCDDYALWATADASKIFNLTSVMQAKGMVPGGYHAFNMCLVGEGQYRLWEPNAGFPWAGSLFKIGENGYNVDKWK